MTYNTVGELIDALRALYAPDLKPWMCYDGGVVKEEIGSVYLGTAYGEPAVIIDERPDYDH